MLKKVTTKITAFSNFLGNNSSLNIEDIDKLSVSKNVVVYSLAWGNYLDIFFNYTLPSIMHSSNIPNLERNGYEISFRIYTIESSTDLEKNYRDQLKKIKKYELNIVSLKEESKKASIIAKHAITDVFKHCIDNNLIMFLAVPDTIFSNYSVYNSVVLTYSKRKTFVSAHPRINRNLLKDFKEFPINGFTSSELVAYALENSHPNFKYSDEALTSNTVHAGISHRKLSESLFIITSNMPTAYVIIPNQDDINFFKKVGTFNEWDRGWLSFLLKKNRVKISGSSDLFFCAEITNENEITEVKTKTSKLPWKDLYSRTFSHRLSNIFVSIWRK